MPPIDLKFVASFGEITKLLFPTPFKRYRKSLLMVTAGLAATPKRMILKDNGQQTLKNLIFTISMILLSAAKEGIELCFTSAFQI